MTSTASSGMPTSSKASRRAVWIGSRSSGLGLPPGNAMWPAWVGIVSGRLMSTTRRSSASSSNKGTNTAALGLPSAKGSSERS